MGTMKKGLEQTALVAWLDATLKPADFDDVSNNGLQVENDGGAVTTVAFAVDASVRAVDAAARHGAQLLVVHHGLSWGGGIRRLTGGVGRVVRAATRAGVSVYASHLPLDAHPVLGNNAQLAKLFGLARTKPSFDYHGNVIGLVGTARRALAFDTPDGRFEFAAGVRLGICSGGAGCFAEEAKRLGCAALVTGEADWGERIAAENAGATLVCLGHYETEVFGVRALAGALKRAFPQVKAIDLTEELQ